MSPVVAVRYLAEFAAEALRPWDPSRELAAKLLADLPLMVRLRRDDAATADEVEHLVLGRFLPAEPPSVPGVDFLAGQVEEDSARLTELAAEMDRTERKPREFADAHGCTWRENGEWLTLLDANYKDSGLNKTPAFVEQVYGPLVEVQPDAEQVRRD